jgi:two-component system OmpR family response regulator
MRILLVEDDPALGEAVRDHLRSLAHAVDREERLASAEAALRAVPYDLVLLDLGLPDGDGLAFLKRLRARGDTTPVIVLTARDRIGERIAGLEAGADDYLVKPFDLGELAARVAAVARRYAGDPNPLLEIGPLLVDRGRRIVTREGAPVTLSAREWALLEALALRPGAIVSKERLEELLYPMGEEVESNAVEVAVSRLRKKLGAEVIETVRGLGYRLAAR